MPQEPGKIRNVAVLGHRGSGKTSLVEALLFQAGAVNRLGYVGEGTTVADYDDDEKRRSLSISCSVCHAEWHDRRLNIIDTPGDPSFQGDALGPLRVVEGAVIVVSGVAGVEVSTDRFWRRAAERAMPRLVHVNLLDRERSDFEAAFESIRKLDERAVAVAIPMGQEHEYEGVIDVLHMVAYPDPEGGREGDPEPIPDAFQAEAAVWRERLVERISESSDELIAKFLEGEEPTAEEIATALKSMVVSGDLFPVTCGAATRNSGTDALLDLIVEGLPSPKRAGPLHARNARRRADRDRPRGRHRRLRLQDHRRPVRRQAHLFRVFAGHVTGDTTLIDTRTRGKERFAALLEVQGKEHHPVTELGRATSAPSRSSRTCRRATCCSTTSATSWSIRSRCPRRSCRSPSSRRARARTRSSCTSLRRLHEEDPTLEVRRDERTSEMLVEGLSQMHVEVTLDRLKRRFGVEVVTHPPRVPYLEAIRKGARGHGRHKKQSGGRGQFGDCHIQIEPLPGHEGYEFVDKIVGGVIPQSFRPAVDKGIQESMSKGVLAGYPVVGVRVSPGRRHVPHGRLLGDGVQDRRLAGLPCRLLRRRPGAARADHGRRHLRARRLRRRRHRRPQLAARPAARHRAARLRDGGPGRGADGGDADLLARPDLDDRRARRLLDGVPALRGDADARRAEGHRQRPEGGLATACPIRPRSR